MKGDQVQPLFEIESAKKRPSEDEDVALFEPMRASGGRIRRNPSTDQKKIRRRQQARTASLPIHYAMSWDGTFGIISIRCACGFSTGEHRPKAEAKAIMREHLIENDGDLEGIDDEHEASLKTAAKTAAFDWSDLSDDSFEEGEEGWSITYDSDNVYLEAFVSASPYGGVSWTIDGRARQGEMSNEWGLSGSASSVAEAKRIVEQKVVEIEAQQASTVIFDDVLTSRTPSLPWHRSSLISRSASIRDAIVNHIASNKGA